MTRAIFWMLYVSSLALRKTLRRHPPNGRECPLLNTNERIRIEEVYVKVTHSEKCTFLGPNPHHFSPRQKLYR